MDDGWTFVLSSTGPTMEALSHFLIISAYSGVITFASEVYNTFTHLQYTQLIINTFVNEIVLIIQEFRQAGQV